MVFIRKARKGFRGKRKMTRKPAMKKAPATKKAAVALIKSVIAREEETKFRSEVICTARAFNSQVLNNDILRLLPQVAQDEGNGSTFERLGSKISVRKLRIDAEVCLTEVNRSSAVIVCYWVLTHKNQRKTDQLTISGGVDLGTMLRTGDNNQYQNFNGFVQDASLPINTLQYNVLKQGKFLLGKNTGVVQDSTTAGNQPLYGNNIRKLLSFNLNCPKTLTYEQDNTLPRTVYFPAGYAPFIVFGYYHQNQTIPDLVNQDVTVTLRSSIWYDDA